MQKITITAADGYPLSALYVKPVGFTLGTVVISSATGVRKEFYVNFSRFLEMHGYSVLMFDYRGIGESAPKKLQTLKSSMHEWGTKDMNAVMDFLVKKEKKTNIIWLGHSVGAQLIGFLENNHHIAKVISISSAFGHWRYLPAPMKWVIWSLWYFVGPLMIRLQGYGNMKKIGWGENLPPNILLEWRKWCLSRTYFQSTLEEELGTDKFYNFKRPITALYLSDDFIANDTTVPLMMSFFPEAPQEIFKLQVEKYTREKVGHTGIFRKKFRHSLWPLLFMLIDQQSLGRRIQN
ncbi:MAG: alpha/beta fold hydrolase [Chitinophagaceae bacterium]|nr:MAG: alpha/beta fold hydrolase [Chitinophagaceae bacterium]